jgi:hypothetical protein
LRKPPFFAFLAKGFKRVLWRKLDLGFQNFMNSSRKVRNENGQNYLWGIVPSMCGKNSSSIARSKLEVSLGKISKKPMLHYT